MDFFKMCETVKKPSLFQYQYILLILIEICSGISIQMMNSTIVGYSKWMGVTSSIAGLIAGLYFWFSLCSRPLSSIVGNRLDKKGVLLLASVLIAIPNVGIVLLPYVPAILICRALTGIGWAFVSTNSMTAVAEVVPKEQVGVAIGYYGLASVVGQMAGPTIALQLSTAIGYIPMYGVSLGFRACAIVGILLLRPIPRVATAVRQRIAVKDFVSPRSIMPATIGLCFAAIYGSISSFLATYATAYNIPGYSYYFLFSAGSMFLFRILFSKRTDSRTLKGTALTSGPLLILSVILLGLFQSTFFMYLAGVCFGAGYGTLLPVTQSLSIKNADPAYRAAGSSTYFIGIDVGLMIGSTLAGIIAQATGNNYATMFLFFAIPGLVGILLAVIQDVFSKQQSHT